MVSIIHRMTTKDCLLTLTPNDEYEFTPRGSQMADLLTDLDACSVQFIENYKELVCMAVLQQRQRLGYVAATPHEVANIANISFDSARRGMDALAVSGVVTINHIPTPGLDLDATINMTSPATPTAPLAAAATATPKGLDAAIDNLIYENGEDAPESFEKAEAADDEILASIETAARISCTPFGGHYDPIAEALAEIDESEAVPIPKGSNDDDDLPLNLKSVLRGMDGDAANDDHQLSFSSIPFAEDDEGIEDEEGIGDGEGERIEDEEGIETEDEDEDDVRENIDDPFAWSNVSDLIRERLIIQAKAAGLSLDLFFDVLSQMHQERIREALFSEFYPASKRNQCP